MHTDKNGIIVGSGTQITGENGDSHNKQPIICNYMSAMPYREVSWIGVLFP